MDEQQSERRTAEAWRDAKQTVAWAFAAARAGERWPLGQELTEAQYDAAIDRAKNMRLG
jgi:hypothetical protein